MKIVMITYNKTGSGTYFRAYQFARELVRLKQSVTLLTTAPTRKTRLKTWDEYGVNLIEFPALFPGKIRSGWDPYNIHLKLRWLKGKQFDVVHGFETRPSVIYPSLKSNLGSAHLVLDWCDWFGKGGSVEERPNPFLRSLLRPIETYYENRFRKIADRTTVICNTLFERAIALGVKKKDLHLIYNGFNMPDWDPVEKSLGRDFFGFDDKEFVIGYVGSLFPKDAMLLSKAFFKVQEQLPNARLLHLGQSNYLPNFESPVKEKMSVTGSIDERTLQIGLSACDICWLPLSDIPANWGRFPLKFSNYLSAGKPVIVTNVGDIQKIVREYRVGLTCAADEVSLSAQTIKLASTPEAIHDFEIAAKKLSQNPEYSWHKLAKDILNIYDQIR